MTTETKGVLDADVSTAAGATGVTAAGSSATLPMEGQVAGTASMEATHVAHAGRAIGAAGTTEMLEVGEGEVIPVLRETLHVSKREVETGRVTIQKTVTERDETVEMLLRQTDVSVERVPVNRVVTEAPASRQDGDVLIIPVLEEVLVTEKRLMLKEELHIRKSTSERLAHEVVRLRSEQVHIEGSGAVTVPPAATPQES